MSRGLALDDAAWDSPWRQRAVFDKAILALGLVLLALLLPAWPGSLIVGVVAVGILVGPAGLRPRLLARCVRGPLVFILLGAASVAVTLTWQGRPALGVDATSVAQAGGLVGHALAGTLAVLVLAATTPMVDLLAALGRVRVPGACIEVAGLIYRMLFSLLESASTIREAQTARLGYASRAAGMRSTSMLVGSVLLRSWTRAERLEEGLAGRGEGDQGLRTLDRPRISSVRFRVGVMALLAAVAAVALALPVGGGGLR